MQTQVKMGLAAEAAPTGAISRSALAALPALFAGAASAASDCACPARHGAMPRHAARPTGADPRARKVNQTRLSSNVAAWGGRLRPWDRRPQGPTGEATRNAQAIPFLAGAAFLLLPFAALAQQTTLCTSLITDHPDNPYVDGVVAVSETFPVEGSGDYTSQWRTYIDGKYAHKAKRTSQCSDPAGDPATAARGRLNFIAQWEAGFATDLAPWRPAQQQPAADAQAVARGDESHASGEDGVADAPGDAAAGNRAAAASAPASGAGASAGQRPPCATQPWDAPNTAFPKGSARKITNTCREPLSVRICLRVDGRWDCGVNWNVPPGADWSWGSTRVYTGWFWDARLASSNAGLAHPEE